MLTERLKKKNIDWDGELRPGDILHAYVFATRKTIIDLIMDNLVEW